MIATLETACTRFVVGFKGDEKYFGTLSIFYFFSCNDKGAC